MQRSRQVALWRTRIAPVFSRAKMVAGKALAETTAQAALHNQLGSSRAALAEAEAVERAGADAITEALALYDLACAEVGASPKAMRHELERAVAEWIETFRKSAPMVEAFGGSGPLIYDQALSSAGTRLRDLIAEHAIRPRARTPLSVSRPILSRAVDALVAGIISLLVALAVKKAGLG